MNPPLSKLANYLIEKLDTKSQIQQKGDLEVNSLISDLASWYEKLRNVIEYKEEEVVLRSAIERILSRRLILGGKGRQLAEPLIRELVWAKYLPHTNIPDQLIDKVTEKIECYEVLEQKIKKTLKKNKTEASKWLFQILTGEIENVISPSKDREILSNFIFQIFKEEVQIKNEELETRDAQVFIATKRAFDKHDLPLLRYDLFIQYFGYLTQKNTDKVASNFETFFEEANKQLTYPLRDTIHSYIKNRLPPFLILEEFFRSHKGEIRQTMQDPDRFNSDVNKIITKRYNQISQKVSTAIKRSVTFIFITKATIALSIEVAIENYLYGSVYWIAIIINVISSPFLMILSTLFIRTPDKNNTNLILEDMNKILYSDNPNLAKKLILDKNAHRLPVVLAVIYGFLWILSLVIGVGTIALILSFFNFTVVSILIFIFFLIIVSFMSYRIYRISQTYTIKKVGGGIRSLIFDFFFIPLILLGKNISQGASQLNVLLFIFDYLIETPFKEMFNFLEQWLFFLRRQRDTLD